MVIFTCSDDFESMMTCIYEAWASRLGHRNLRLMTEPVGNLELFCEYRHVEPDREKADRVMRSIRTKISAAAYQTVFSCAMSCDPQKLDLIYRFLLLGFAHGPRVTDMLQHPAVNAVFACSRRVMNESHRFCEFVRFARAEGGILVSHIEPRSDILTFLAPYFADRMPSEHWMIVDDSRKTAVVHQADSGFYLTTLNEQEFSELSALEKSDDLYTALWKGFFSSIAIQERCNPRCQRTFLPQWYRKNVTEFQP